MERITNTTQKMELKLQTQEKFTQLPQLIIHEEFGKLNSTKAFIYGQKSQITLSKRSVPSLYEQIRTKKVSQNPQNEVATFPLHSWFLHAYSLKCFGPFTLVSHLGIQSGNLWHLKSQKRPPNEFE